MDTDNGSSDRKGFPHGEFEAPFSSARTSAFVELHEMLSEYWARVDRLSNKSVAEMYTSDGEMLIGSLHKTGSQQISEFFAERNRSEQQIGRNTRHVFSNMRIEWISTSRVIVLSLVIAYAAIGEFPLAAPTAPATIADFTDVCTRDSSGNWKIESKTARILLTGDGAAKFVR